VAFNERSDDDEGPLPARQLGTTMLDDGCAIRIVRHPFDHSVFVNQLYVIKGIAGRLLMHMLRRHRADGQQDFTNCELRLAMTGALPVLKANIETRLLLHRRSLDALQLQIRMHHTGRGRLHLDVHGRTELREEE
jgi:adenylate cyclase